MKVSSVRINSNATATVAVINRNLSAAVGAMANAILATSRMTAPLKTGALRYSGQVKGGGLQRDITYGSGRVPYAAYQERGARADGSHVVRHYTTPGTGKDFLKNAGEAIVKKGIKPYL